MITMLLGGLWHGAGWNWVVWGGLQGGMMTVERLTGMKEEHPKSMALRLARWFITFHLACLSWVFFRARGLDGALLVLQRIGTWAPGDLTLSLRPLLYLAILLLAELASAKEYWVAYVQGAPRSARWLAYAAFAVFVLTFAGAENPEFIYFQF